MLRNNWPGNFRRAGIVFEPGKAVALSKKQYEAVKGDIGSALVEVEIDDLGRPRVNEVQDAVTSNLEQIIAEQQAAIDLLIEQVKELGGVPVVGIDESDSASEGSKTTAE